jgi:hypothetical protein
MLMLIQSCLENQQENLFIFTKGSYLLSTKSATGGKKCGNFSVKKMSQSPLAPPDQYQVQVQVELKILHLPC